jgi:hypothetical protein
MAELAGGAQFKGSPTWGDPVHAAHNWGQLLVLHTDDCARALVRELSQSATPVYAHVVLQKALDEGMDEAELPTEVTLHDLERAEDTVKELERLDLWPPGTKSGTN